MTQHTNRLVPLFAAAMLAAIAATPATAGPPWISVEHPVNPHHSDTRDALALVHTYHHGDARHFPLEGRAEGVVDGRQVRLPLRIEQTYRKGVYAVRGELPDGAWVLVLTMTDTESGARASALVALDGRRVTRVQVPGEERNGWMVPRQATAGDIESMMRTSVALARLGQESSTELSGARLEGALGVAGALLLMAPLTLLGRAARRARPE